MRDDLVMVEKEMMVVEVAELICFDGTNVPFLYYLLDDANA